MAYRSKWLQSRLLRGNPVTARCIPETAPYNKDHLRDFLRRYSSVYIKPDGGMRGIGIFRVDRIQSGYMIRGRSRTLKRVRSLEGVYRALKHFVQPRKHILQQRIQSETADGHPFDFRVHVQRLGKQWVVGGIFAKIGKRKKIVTNVCSGSRPVFIKSLLRRHLKLHSGKADQIKRELKRISIAAATEMDQAYPGWREYGVDIGMDKMGRLWIFEVNLSPGIHSFANLPDRRDYRRILKNRQRQRKWAI